MTDLDLIAQLEQRIGRKLEKLRDIFRFRQKSPKETPMTDLDIIAQLEQRIGRKLEKLRDIIWTSVGYQLNENNQVSGLGLSNCKLTELPLEIAQLQNLQFLRLDSNQLSVLPPEIAQLQNLQYLDLNSNQLSVLPPEIAQLQNLQYLYLSFNQLSVLPPEIAQLQNLKILSLSSNQLSALPPEIAQLQNLQYLYLSFNQLSVLPPEIAQLKNLQYLDLNPNQLSALPPEIGQLQNLEGLSLNYNQLSALPPEIAQLQNLEILGLESNQLSTLPPEIGQLQNLQYLYLSSNQLSTLPPEIAQLQNLQYLDLNSNQLSALPPEIAQLQNLQILNLKSNKLSALPPEIAQLQNLEGLSLNYNRLGALPLEIGQLQNLQVLDLNSNQLSTLPPEIAQLQNLKALSLDGNPLETPPREIIERGLDAIREYLKPLRHAHALNELKAIFVGDGASGKTSVIKQLFGEPFDKHESQTHGILIRDWVFSTERLKDVKAHLWDFGGQEIMHATHQFFLSKRSLYLLILDGRKDEKTEYWLQHIESFGGKSPTLIILNKMDENPGFDVNRKFLKEKYPFILDFHRVSCKTKEGIAALKSAIQQAALQVEVLKTLWSSAWLAVKIALEQKNEAQVDFIPYDTYVALCRQKNISEQKSQQVLVTFLHDLGIVIYFNELGLEETSVINPRWVTQAVYDIITSPLLAEQQGVIKRTEIEPLLNPQTHPRHKHNYIIELMKKFELCYELEDKQTILIPDLLPVEEPNFDFDTKNAIRFILQYKFLPKSIIAKFIVKMHRYIKQQLRWRTGVVLENQRFNAAAVVKADEEAKKIFIDVNGQQKREYFAALLYMFRDIHQIFAKMDVEELIRLPDNPNETVSYKKLVNLEQRGKTEYSGDNKDYQVHELLGSVRSDNPTLEMMTVLHKLSDQMLTQEEFLKKIEHFFQKQTSRGELSEETAKELGLGVISAFFGVDPHRFWKILKEIRDRAWRIV